tara:strand:- start:31 stop:354 length:324 start_codon:yes stop_codon:yes gene_type:complete
LGDIAEVLSLTTTMILCSVVATVIDRDSTTRSVPLESASSLLLLSSSITGAKDNCSLALEEAFVRVPLLLLYRFFCVRLGASAGGSELLDERLLPIDVLETKEEDEL